MNLRKDHYRKLFLFFKKKQKIHSLVSKDRAGVQLRPCGGRQGSLGSFGSWLTATAGVGVFSHPRPRVSPRRQCGCLYELGVQPGGVASVITFMPVSRGTCPVNFSREALTGRAPIARGLTRGLTARVLPCCATVQRDEPQSYRGIPPGESAP